MSKTRHSVPTRTGFDPTHRPSPALTPIALAVLAAMTLPHDASARSGVARTDIFSGCAPLHGLRGATAGCDRLPAELRAAVQRIGDGAVAAGFFPAHAAPLRRPQPARAAGVVPVTTCADTGPGSLRAAVDAAVSGDVIDLTQLQCSAITLSEDTLIAEVENLTINGPGSDRLLVSGNNTKTVLAHIGPEGARGTLSVSGVSLIRGRNQHGTPGGCVFAYGDLVLDDVTIDTCHAQRVAGINVGGDLTMRSSRITRTQSLTDNYLTFGGGALVYGGATITDSTISGNTVATTSPIGGAMGAGIRVQGGDFTATRSAFSGNTVRGAAVVAGAGIWISGGNVTLVESVVDDNRLEPTRTDFEPLKVGAGISVLDANVSITGSTISNNVATNAFGGGVHVQKLYDPDRTPVVLLGNSTVSGNVADWGAGGVVTWQTQGLTINNSTLSANVVDRSFEGFGNAGITIRGSGGVWHQADDAFSLTVDVLSSILHGNRRNDTATASDIGVLTDWGTGSVSQVSVAGSRNLLGVAEAGVVFPADTLTTDPGLGLLADNGGRTRTHALAPGSAAIDAGAAGAYTHDQRGPAFPRVVGSAADIGAFEWSDVIFANGFD